VRLKGLQGGAGCVVQGRPLTATSGGGGARLGCGQGGVGEWCGVVQQAGEVMWGAVVRAGSKWLQGLLLQHVGERGAGI
jgi:hypothetical protein